MPPAPAAHDASHVPPDGPGAILSLIRAGLATTRQALIERTGLSRSTIGQRLDLLTQAGFIHAATVTASTGGRPAAAFAIDAGAGFMLLAAAGATALQVAIADMAGQLLARRTRTQDIAAGPQAVLGQIQRLFDELLAERGAGAAQVRGIGIGLPGPIERHSGRVVRPPIMTGWDGYAVPAFFATHYDCPVSVDNDANLMALGEHRQRWPDQADLLYLKLGTGIGAGIIADGRLQRGAHGAAGDLGHWHLASRGSDEPLCRCGQRGCLEAYASGWAALRDLPSRWPDLAIGTMQDIARLAEAGHQGVLEHQRRCGEQIGEALAMAVSLLNPGLVVVGGAMAGDQLLATLRETIYRRCLPLATRELQVVRGGLGSAAGLHGAAQQVADAWFDPLRVDAWLAAHAG